MIISIYRFVTVTTVPYGSEQQQTRQRQATETCFLHKVVSVRQYSVTFKFEIPVMKLDWNTGSYTLLKLLPEMWPYNKNNIQSKYTQVTFQSTKNVYHPSPVGSWNLCFSPSKRVTQLFKHLIRKPPFGDFIQGYEKVFVPFTDFFSHFCYMI